MDEACLSAEAAEGFRRAEENRRMRHWQPNCRLSRAEWDQRIEEERRREALADAEFGPDYDPFAIEEMK